MVLADVVAPGGDERQRRLVGSQHVAQSVDEKLLIFFDLPSIAANELVTVDNYKDSVRPSAPLKTRGMTRLQDQISGPLPWQIGQKQPVSFNCSLDEVEMQETRTSLGPDKGSRGHSRRRLTVNPHASVAASRLESRQSQATSECDFLIIQLARSEEHINRDQETRFAGLGVSKDCNDSPVTVGVQHRVQVFLAQLLTDMKP